jgi:hypothetical protein
MLRIFVTLPEPGAAELLAVMHSSIFLVLDIGAAVLY